MRFLFSALAAAALPAAAHADSVNVQLYRSPFNLNYAMVESAIHDNAPWEQQAFVPKYFGSANYSYVKDPLVVIDTTTNTRVNTLVNSVHTLELAGGYFLSPTTSVYAELPLTYSNLPGQGGALGLADARLAGKFALNDVSQPLNFAVMPELMLPTGNKARFLSDNGVGLGALLIAENDFGTFRMTGNLGYRYSGSARASGIDYRSRIPIGLGAAIPLARKWLMNLEASGALAIPTAQKQNASQFYGGFSYSPKKYVTWMFGGALGAFDQTGSSQYRLLAAVRVYFDEKKPALRLEEPVPEPAPAPKPAPVAHLSVDKSHIEIEEEIQFENNSDKLKVRGRQILDEVADIIRQHDAEVKSIEVEGHTSHTGTYKHNMDLSWRRSRAVIAYLVHEQKVPAKYLVAKGYGWTRPKNKKKPAAAENRRVEFKVNRKKG